MCLLEIRIISPPHSAVWIIPSRGLRERRECFPVRHRSSLVVRLIFVRTLLVIFQTGQLYHWGQHYFGPSNKSSFLTQVVFSRHDSGLASFAKLTVSSLAGVRRAHNAYATGQHNVPPRRKPAPGPGKSLLQRVSRQ